MQKKLVIRFSGNVHGVGFRFTSDRIAQKFNVTGYVRNLSDGGVMILAEGEEIVLLDFFAALQDSSMKKYIKNVETEWSEPQGEHGFFGIVH